MNSTHQATRITTLGASAILALTCATACGTGSAVERDPAPARSDLQFNEGSPARACASAPGQVDLRRSPPPDCGGHPSHPTWTEYRLVQETR